MGKLKPGLRVEAHGRPAIRLNAGAVDVTMLLACQPLVNPGKLLRPARKHGLGDRGRPRVEDPSRQDWRAFARPVQRCVEHAAELDEIDDNRPVRRIIGVGRMEDVAGGDIDPDDVLRRTLPRQQSHPGGMSL